MDDYELVDGVWAPKFVTNAQGVLVPRRFDEQARADEALNELFNLHPEQWLSSADIAEQLLADAGIRWG